MATAHDIDMREVRSVSAQAIAEEASFIAACFDEIQDVFSRIWRLPAAAAALDWLQFSDNSQPTQPMVEGFHSKPDDRSALIEVLDAWREMCGDRERDERMGMDTGYWRVERKAAERVRAYVAEL